MLSILNGKTSGDAQLDKECARWLTWDGNAESRRIVNEWVSAEDWTTLRSRMMTRLEFGTAGLRGVMRPGFDSMNDLVIVQTAQGLCQYIKKQQNVQKMDKPSFVLGYDGRYNSKRFAELSAAVFINNGFKVYLYSRMVATPFVPFAIQQKKCVAGVMVTASHNPKEDNGYKVYWGNGAQIISPHDKGIQDSILQNLEPVQSSWETEMLKSCPCVDLEDPYEEMTKLYNEELLKYIPPRFRDINAKSQVKFIYTAMHGVGYPYVTSAFEAASLTPAERLVPVEEQKLADPDFPTVKFPNPEEGKSALQLSTELGNRTGINIILANDPDADRLALAVKDPKHHEWKVFNGNELGALLGWWVVHNYKELHPQVKLGNCYVLASTVSSKILRSMAAIDGYCFEETLTGFKWMGNRAIELMAAGKEVLFAFEEAIGYMFSTNVLDKDGVSAATHLATMASYLQAVDGITLIEKLDQIYDKYGYHCTNCSYLFCHDKPLIKKIFTRLRKFQTDATTEYSYPKSILDGEFVIEHVRDLTVGLDTSQPNGKAVLPSSSSSQMITFSFTNGFVITLRTSGTEPKIKYYAELCGKPEDKDRQRLRNTLDRMCAAIVEEFLQPRLNNLQPKAD